MTINLENQLSLLFDFSDENVSQHNLSEEAITWDENEVLELKSGVLIKTLDTFKNSVRPEVLEEIMNWVNDKNSNNPFSFIECARASAIVFGYENFDIGEFRDQTLSLMRRSLN